MVVQGKVNMFFVPLGYEGAPVTVVDLPSGEPFGLVQGVRLMGEPEIMPFMLNIGVIDRVILAD